MLQDWRDGGYDGAHVYSADDGNAEDGHRGDAGIDGHREQGVANVLGLMAHFMAGVVFALMYALLWSMGIGSASWIWGLFFGAVHGIVAMVMIPLLIRMHPRAPEMAEGAMAKAGKLMAHLVYGLMVALVYAAF